MSTAKPLLALLLAFLLPALAARCGGGDGSGGSPVVLELSSPDRRCVTLADVAGFPPDFDFVPDVSNPQTANRVVAATAIRSNLIPIEIEDEPFVMPPGVVSYSLPRDADGDGIRELFKSINRLRVVSEDLALVTTSGTTEAESVLFLDPGVVGGRQVNVAVPLDFVPEHFAAYPGLPAPGTSALRTGITTAACVAPGADALDSRGERLEDAVPSFLWCDGPGSFTASFTAGASVLGGRLYAAVSNVGVDPGAEDTQFLPGAVVVYDIDLAVDPPTVMPAVATPDGRPYVVTSGFNPTSVTGYTTPSGRSLALVTLTGAIGIRADDPNTSGLEGGAVRITDGAIDVFDAITSDHIATIPLHDASPGFDDLAIDPTGTIAMLGDLNARNLYAVDLREIDALPLGPPIGGPMLLEAAVIFDGLNPLEVPALSGGAPAVSCPGQIVGVGFSVSTSRAYALESCDGTLATLSVDLAGNPSTAELRNRIAVNGLFPVTAPLTADTFDQVRRPSSLKVRPGIPGVDYFGPDVFFLVGEPEPQGLLCGIRLDSL